MVHVGLFKIHVVRRRGCYGVARFAGFESVIAESQLDTLVVIRACHRVVHETRFQNGVAQSKLDGSVPLFISVWREFSATRVRQA